MTDEADDMIDDADRRTLDALGDALGRETLPDGLLDRAAGLLAWADIDHELASLLDEADLEQAGTRGAAIGSLLEFRLDDGTIVIDVDIDERAVRGQIVGGDATRVELARADGRVDGVEVDDLGSFSFDDVTPGSVRIVLRSGGRAIHTDWFVV
jgi:hypothetical protein